MIAFPAGTLLNDESAGVALSPDGKTIVFAANADGTSQLYLRPIDRLAATPIPDTLGAKNPFFSPDGRWIGFAADHQIKKIAVGGGAAQIVCDALVVRGASWNRDGTIVFSAPLRAGLSTVSAAGGTPRRLTTPDAEQREKSHRWPDILPGGAALLMTVGNADITSFEDARIEVLTIATGTRRMLIQGGTHARYVPTGHIVYARAGSLLAVPFDLDKLEVTGPPTALSESVFVDGTNGLADFAVSSNGSLVFAPAGVRTHDATLVWVDRQGRATTAAEIHRTVQDVRLSPDGGRIAVGVEGANNEVWVYDLARTTFTRLVYGFDNTNAIWTPDGSRVTFPSNRARALAMYWQSVDGTGVAERLVEGRKAETWSPDGQVLVFAELDAATKWDLWTMRADDRVAHPFLRTPANEVGARLSADGRWIAYASDRSGAFEVYVQAFPGPSRRWQVTTDGGTTPIWSPSGGELFYRQGNRVMGVGVTTTPEFSAGRPTLVFDGPYVVPMPGFAATFDVARDGRFLMIKEAPQPISQLILVQNWFTELKSKAGGR